MRLACMPRTGNCTISSCAARRKGRKQHMDRISLWYCEGASDKIYEAEIVPVSDGFQVNFAYGRRAGTMNTGTKTSTPVPYAQAKKIFDTLVRAKLAKGYEPMGASIKVFTGLGGDKRAPDRKSTRLNSSHLGISY